MIIFILFCKLLLGKEQSR